MASRLLSRYASLLCRMAPQAPVSASAARLSFTLPPPSVVLRPQARQTTTDRFMCEQKTVADEEIVEKDLPPTNLDELGNKFVAWAKSSGKGKVAAKALVECVAAVRKEKGELAVLRADPRIKDMMKSIERNVAAVWDVNLVHVLGALWAMDVPASNPTMKSVEKEIIWRMRKLRYKHMVHLVDICCRKGLQDGAIMTAALKDMELRWTEIADSKTVSNMMTIGQHLPPLLRLKLEDKALELAETFSASDIRRTFVALAVQSRRSVPLLRALSYHLFQRPSEDLTTPFIMDVAFAYGKLNFHHPQVFQRLAAELLPRCPKLDAHDVARFAKSLAFLKWLHLPLFEAFARHFTTVNYPVPETCNLLMAFARLNFQPSNAEAFYKKLHTALENVLPTLDPFLRTDVVWSLCVLQQANPSYIIPLLKQSHVTKLSEGSASQLENYRLKLLHIAATLQLEHLEFSSVGPPALPPCQTRPGVSPRQREVRESLQSLVGERAWALQTGVDTIHGWTIDGQLNMDGDNQPLSLEASDKSQGLPAGPQRVAFVVWEYPNFCSKSKDLLGRFVMMKRHLELAGFIIVEVPYYEWQEPTTQSNKVSYLKGKMMAAVAKDKA